MVNFLSVDMANDIVKIASQIIGQKIMVTDQDGIVLASNNPSDIGSYHKVAKQIIDQKLSHKHVLYDNNEDGTITGVNYPLIAGDIYIGVVEVAGKSDEVAKYGQLITKMTSIMLLEDSLKQRKYNYDMLQQTYLKEWLNSNGHLEPSFITRGKALNINLSIKRRIVMFRLLPNSLMTTHEEYSVVDSLKARLDLYIRQKDAKALFVFDKYILTMATSITDDIKVLDFILDLVEFIEQTQLFKVYVGISEYPSNQTCKSQKKMAIDALQAALIHPKKRIIFYNELTIETISHMILPHHQVNYLHNVFRNYSEDEITDTVNLLDAYYANDGSLRQTALQLHLHTNTLQYQLRKIKEKTEYDPRSLKDSAIFTLAIYFHKNLA